MENPHGKMFWYISKLKARFTTDEDLDEGEEREADPEEVIAYLKAAPSHAIVILDLEEVSGECTFSTPQYILRGAGEDQNNYYYGDMPAEDPGDASGGDITAEEAFMLAIDDCTMEQDG